MKMLQNNFTTPEQSKRLLKLGVPEWAADCVTSIYGGSTFFVQERQLLRRCIDSNNYIPCWSVGRLIEIFLLCTPYKDIALNTSNLVEQMVVSLFMVNKDGLLDFSKLED